MSERQDFQKEMIPWPEAESDIDYSSAQTSTSRIFKPNNGRRKTVEFVNEQLPEQFFQTLSQYRKDGTLCDVVLLTEHAESESTKKRAVIRAHRIVLASISPYFSAMFTTPMKEHSMQEITLKEIDGDALLELVEYMYSGKIRICENSVISLLETAGILQLNCVRDACSKFLLDQLDASNCIGIQAFATVHGCSQLASAARSYTQRNFSNVVSGDEFSALDVEELFKIISDDKLDAKEEEIFYAVRTWIIHDEENRKEFLPRLLMAVRLPQINKEFLFSKIQDDPLVKTSEKCKDVLLESMRFMYNKELKIEASNWNRPRQPVRSSQLIMLIGGQAPKANYSVDVYDPHQSLWSQCAPLTTRRCRSGAAAIDNFVYVLGGFNGSARVRTTDIYERTLDTWIAGPLMGSRRSTLGVTSVDNIIYAVGGFDGNVGLASAEMLDIRTANWRELPSMSIRRSSVAVASCQGLIYAVGGYDGFAKECTDTVEYFDIRANRWNTVPAMNHVRSGAGVTVYKDQIIVAGGHEGPTVRDSVEIYDGNAWKMLPDMQFKRRNAGIVVANDMLYALGGDDGQKNLDSIEVMDLTKGFDCSEWKVHQEKLPTARSYAAVTVLSNQN